jgi:hypothetical protein
MSLKVAPTVPPRLAEHARRVQGSGAAVGWLVGPIASTSDPVVIVGSLCCSEEVATAGSQQPSLLADLQRASALLPGGLAVVGAYTTTSDETMGVES